MASSAEAAISLQNDAIISSRNTTTGSSRSVVVLLSRLRSARGQADPYPIYAKLRELGGVVSSPWGKLMTTYRTCEHVLHGKSWLSPDWAWREARGQRWTSPANRELSWMLPTLNPPEHTAQRRMLGNVFDRRTLRRLRATLDGLITEELDELERRLSDGGDADFAEVVSDELPAAAIGAWLGIPRADLPVLRTLTHDYGYAQDLFPTPAHLARADEASIVMRDYFARFIADRRTHPRDDVVSSWLSSWDAIEPDRDVADTTVRRLAHFLFMTGIETTAMLLSTAIWLLDQHPDQAHWLRQNLQEIPIAVEEILRYDTPVHVSSRVAADDIVLDGVEIPRGQLVHILFGSANHDPEATADPDRFDIRRRGRHLSFGAGVHHCIGAGLARLEAAMLLERLLPRFPALRVSAAPAWEPRMAFRHFKSLRISAR